MHFKKAKGLKLRFIYLCFLIVIGNKELFLKKYLFLNF